VFSERRRARDVVGADLRAPEEGDGASHEPAGSEIRPYQNRTSSGTMSNVAMLHYATLAVNPFIELASTDPTFIEYFPRLASTPSAPFYFQSVNFRPTSAEITADGRKGVRLITTDDGVGAYNVLGMWKDSHYCYYF